MLIPQIAVGTESTVSRQIKEHLKKRDIQKNNLHDFLYHLELIPSEDTGLDFDLFNGFDRRDRMIRIGFMIREITVLCDIDAVSMYSALTKLDWGIIPLLERSYRLYVPKDSLYYADLLTIFLDRLEFLNKMGNVFINRLGINGNAYSINSLIRSILEETGTGVTVDATSKFDYNSELVKNILKGYIIKNAKS